MLMPYVGFWNNPFTMETDDHAEWFCAKAFYWICCAVYLIVCITFFSHFCVLIRGSFILSRSFFVWLLMVFFTFLVHGREFTAIRLLVYTFCYCYGCCFCCCCCSSLHSVLFSIFAYTPTFNCMLLYSLKKL